MKKEKQIYNEPIMEVIELPKNSDILTLSGGETGSSSGSEDFDDMFNNW